MSLEVSPDSSYKKTPEDLETIVDKYFQQEEALYKAAKKYMHLPLPRRQTALKRTMDSMTETLEATVEDVLRLDTIESDDEKRGIIVDMIVGESTRRASVFNELSHSDGFVEISDEESEWMRESGSLTLEGINKEDQPLDFAEWVEEALQYHFEMLGDQTDLLMEKVDSRKLNLVKFGKFALAEAAGVGATIALGFFVNQKRKDRRKAKN